jgi:murein DD-endopeptidase MepM/ murein hydrolase activator NlpD
MDTKFPVAGKITATFGQPRPLEGPKTHIHGAIDIACPVGTAIFAPEDGVLFYGAVWRTGNKTDWICRENYPWQNYFYDIFGGLIILKTFSGRVHLFAHSYFNQLYNRGFVPDYQWIYIEQPEDERYPVHGMITNIGTPKKKGEHIGDVGNAGYSTGAHVHWEIHNAWEVTPYAERLDPRTFAVTG